MADTWQGILKLKNMKLTNFRQFHNLDISFHERLTVLIGENGSGKTTVLEAIAKSLELFDRRIQTPLEVNIDVLEFLKISDINNTSKDFTTISLDTKWEVLLNNASAQIEHNLKLEEINRDIDKIELEHKEELEYLKENREKEISFLRSEQFVSSISKTVRENIDNVSKSEEQILKLIEEEFDNIFAQMFDKIEFEFSEKSSNLENKLSDNINALNERLEQISALQSTEPRLELTRTDSLYEQINEDSENKKETGFGDISSTSIIAGEIDAMRRKRDVYNGHTLLAYYPCFALNTSSDKVGEKNKNPRISKFTYNSLTDGRPGNIHELSEWFRDEQGLAGQRNDYTILTMVKDAILNLLNNDLENSTYTDLFFDYETRELTIKKSGVDIRVSQFSSGEQMLFLLVTDLAKRIIMQHPHLEEPLKNGTGIVLIDEIDLHLHPSWQRRVIPQLLKTFKGVQFVVTTHSPLVLTHLDAITDSSLENDVLLQATNKFCLVYNLSKQENEEAISIKEVEYFAGLSLDEFIYENYGITKRSEITQYQLDKLFDLIDQGNDEKATQLYRKLKKQLGSSDPAILDAESFLQPA
jgi:predicted ATP-binding protein involved in virulence